MVWRARAESNYEKQGNGQRICPSITAVVFLVDSSDTGDEKALFHIRVATLFSKRFIVDKEFFSILHHYKT
jgi:hypothetical protein